MSKNLKRSLALKGNKNPLGFKHTALTRAKLSLVRRGNKNALGSKRSEEHKKRISEANRGSNSPHWRGGISRGKHGGNEYRQWRSDVFERDNWTCQTCGLRGVYLEAHHIKSWAYFPNLRYDLGNGVALCRECHALTDNYKGKNNGFSNHDSDKEDSGAA